jgi:hypothetical protein
MTRPRRVASLKTDEHGRAIWTPGAALRRLGWITVDLGPEDDAYTRARIQIMERDAKAALDRAKVRKAA